MVDIFSISKWWIYLEILHKSPALNILKVFKSWI